MNFEKAKLTKEAAAALKGLLDERWPPSKIVANHADPSFLWDPNHLNELGLDQLCRALYVGYEVYVPDQIVTVTEENRKGLIALHDDDGGDPEFDRSYKDGMRECLNELGITIEGINDGEVG